MSTITIQSEGRRHYIVGYAAAKAEGNDDGIRNGQLSKQTLAQTTLDLASQTWWAAVLDGDREGADLRSTRVQAEADAAWLRGHPAVADRARFGHGGIVRVEHLEECEWTGEMVEVGK